MVDPHLFLTQRIGRGPFGCTASKAAHLRYFELHSMLNKGRRSTMAESCRTGRSHVAQTVKNVQGSLQVGGAGTDEIKIAGRR
jgi:hypothetical protein